MTDAELAAVAKDAIHSTWIGALSHKPEFSLRTARHILAWTPERALAALAVIEAARIVDDDRVAIVDALTEWDALP